MSTFFPIIELLIKIKGIFFLNNLPIIVIKVITSTEGRYCIYLPTVTTCILFLAPHIDHLQSSSVIFECRVNNKT